jgi:aldose 1-epimerase
MLKRIKSYSHFIKPFIIKQQKSTEGFLVFENKLGCYSFFSKELFKEGVNMNVSNKNIGVVDHQTVKAFTLMNDHGIEITVLNYGCTITKIMTPDRNGEFENIVLGYDTLEDYLNHRSYFGCIVGRVAGRIAGATFSLDGKTYTLAANDNGNNLHSGVKSFSHVVWEAKPIKDEKYVGVHFFYRSPDGEEGFPGNVEMNVTYLLTNENELIIRYKGTTDQKTILNVTNHSYFNLSGDLKRDILHHSLKMNSSQYVELNNELLPTGNLIDVDNSPFDFRIERLIQDGVNSNHPQNKLVGAGYDHPFVLRDDKEIVLTDKESGRTLTIQTNEVGVVLYTGNMLPNDTWIRGKKSRKYLGLCLETQGLPDAIHHPHFPSIVLNEGEVYQSETRYIFGNR